jgi:osmotically-inducible protein OsmY
MVGNWYEKYQAEQVTEGVKGVVTVFNNVSYNDPWSWKTDWEILEDIEDQLFWSPYVDEEDVNVTVHDGVVTLTGAVDTWAERMTAEENAYDGGAKDVVNHLTVTHHYYGPHHHGYHGPRFHAPYPYRPYW